MSLESLKARWEQAGAAERVARRRLDAEIIRVAGTGAGQREIARRLGWYPQRVAKVLAAAEAGAAGGSAMRARMGSGTRRPTSRSSATASST